MTTREFLTAVATGSMSTEIAQEAVARLNAMDAKTSADKAKRDADNAPIVAAVKEILADGKTHTASDIAARANITTPKATAIVKKINGVKVDEVSVNKRIVNGYHI